MTTGRTAGSSKTAPQRRRVSVASAAKKGGYATLVALRDRLAADIDECRSKRDLAALSARLSAVVAQLEIMRAPPERSIRDEIAFRRAQRRAEAGVEGLAKAPESLRSSGEAPDVR